MEAAFTAKIPSTPTIRNNLAWQNVGGEGTGTCSDWALSNGNLIADPIFCGLATGDFSLAANSPALSHPAGPLGAIPDTGLREHPGRAHDLGSDQGAL